jgi:hypothetical protein
VPGGVFAWPGGVFAWPGGVTEAGGWRSVAAGESVGGGDGARLTGTVTAGGSGEEVGAGFGRPTLAAGVGCATGATGAVGVATTPGGGEVVRREAWCPAFEMVGA